MKVGIRLASSRLDSLNILAVEVVRGARGVVQVQEVEDLRIPQGGRTARGVRGVMVHQGAAAREVPAAAAHQVAAILPTLCLTNLLIPAARGVAPAAAGEAVVEAAAEAEVVATCLPTADTATPRV